MTTRYGDKSYWDERYKNSEESFDWYQEYDGLKNIFDKNINKSDKILMVGCGNSLLTERMYNDDYKTIVNVDISTVLIDQLKEKYKDYEGLEYYDVNVLDTPFNDDAFDSIVDKGTFDAIMCGDNLHENALKMCEEIFRILKPNGKFIMISYGEPNDRLFYLEQETEWSIEVITLERPNKSKIDGYHYCYICTKPEYEQNDDDDHDEDDEEDEDDEDEEENDDDDHEEENDNDDEN